MEEQLAWALKDLGYTGVEDLKLLGVDWTSEDAINYGTAAKRVAKAAKAIANLRYYATSGVKYLNIARAHAMQLRTS